MILSRSGDYLYVLDYGTVFNVSTSNLQGSVFADIQAVYTIAYDISTDILYIRDSYSIITIGLLFNQKYCCMLYLLKVLSQPKSTVSIVEKNLSVL